MSHGGFSRDPFDAPRVETNHRQIVTPIPHPESVAILEKLDRYESVAMHGQLPIVWERASDYQVSDAWGNTWIDFTSTIFVANAGHGNKRILTALQDQLDAPLLTTYTYATRARADYHEYLIENTPEPFDKAFLLSAGTEATECALKLMRLNGMERGKRRGGVITFEGNWHGRTLGAQMLSHNPSQKEWIGYHDPNIHHLPFPYPWVDAASSDPEAFFHASIEALCKDQELDPSQDLCGFLLETFQGWGAVFYPQPFVQAAEAFAREHDMLLAFDEMQSGFGRTGRLFGYEHYGVEPDLLCCGKGAASSLPLSVVLGRAHLMDLPEIGSMSSTHSANPLVCAAGHANLQALIEDGLIENSRTLGETFHEKLDAIKRKYTDHIRYVFGTGLLAGVHFLDAAGEPLSQLCDAIAEDAMRSGLLVVHTGRETIKLAPPLSISEDALLEGLDVFDQSIASGLERTYRGS